MTAKFRFQCGSPILSTCTGVLAVCHSADHSTRISLEASMHEYHPSDTSACFSENRVNSDFFPCKFNIGDLKRDVKN